MGVNSFLPLNARLPVNAALYFFVRRQGQMLLFANKMGVPWYLRFAVKIANNRYSLSKY